MRNNSLDIAKGIGIILVVIGHCISGTSILGKCISSVHMPLFFLISGLCFNEIKHANLIPFFKQRFRQILVPCFLFTAIFITISPAVSIYKLKYGLPGSLWFLLILFIIAILYSVLHKITEKCYGSNYLLVYILFLCLLISGEIYYHDISLPYKIHNIPGAIFYYGIGHQLKHTNIISFIQKTKNSLSSIIIAIVLLILPFTHGILRNEPYYSLSSCILAIGGCISIIIISKFIEKNTFNKIFIWLGKNTLYIMALNMLFIELSCILIQPLVDNYLIYKVIEQIFVWLLCIIPIPAINKYFPTLVGKYK